MENYSALSRVAFGSSRISPPDGTFAPAPLQNSGYLINGPSIFLVAFFALVDYSLIERVRHGSVTTFLNSNECLPLRVLPVV